MQLLIEIHRIAIVAGLSVLFSIVIYTYSNKGISNDKQRS